MTPAVAPRKRGVRLKLRNPGRARLGSAAPGSAGTAYANCTPQMRVRSSELQAGDAPSFIGSGGCVDLKRVPHVINPQRRPGSATCCAHPECGSGLRNRNLEAFLHEIRGGRPDQRRLSELPRFTIRPKWGDRPAVRWPPDGISDAGAAARARRAPMPGAYGQPRPAIVASSRTRTVAASGSCALRQETSVKRAYARSRAWQRHPTFGFGRSLSALAGAGRRAGSFATGGASSAASAFSSAATMSWRSSPFMRPLRDVLSHHCSEIPLWRSWGAA